MIASFFFVLFICVVSVSGRLSGIYLDNGLDQTMIQRLLSKQEKKHVEEEILDILGLPTKPKPSIPVRLDNSAPKFLIDVYQSLSNEDELRRSEFGVTGDDQKAIDESDIIISFSPQKRHIEGLRHEGGRRLWFDVSEVNVADILVGAELRLHQGGHGNRRHGSCSLTLYQVLRDHLGNPELEYVDTVNTTADHEGWLVLNVTKPLSTWVAIPNLNLGLYLTITCHGAPGHELRPIEIGIVPAGGESSHQPFMVGFFKSSGTIKQNIRPRRDTTRRRKKKSQNNPEDRSYAHNPLLRPPKSRWTLHSCQLQNLYVSFKDLEWHEWIIAPEGYQAFYCSGECTFPLSGHMNATNHAIIQTLVHLIKPLKVPKPCCAPTKLSAISVLYYINDKNVTLKKYKNMAVKSCGCQ